MTNTVSKSQEKNLRIPALISAHEHVVKGAAVRFRRLIGPRVDFDSLISDGMLGLWRAAENWPNPTDEGFDAYAYTYARRAMVDGLRKEWGRTYSKMGRKDRSLDEPVTDDGEAVLGDWIPDPRQDVERVVEAREEFIEKAIITSKDRPGIRVGMELAPSELEVLRGAAMGETMEETAKRLHKGVETVKSQKKKINHKLQATNITNAVYLAAKKGLI